MSQTDPSELARAALAGSIPYDLLQRVAAASTTTASAMLEALAVCVARNYAAGDVPFDDARAIMNAVFTVATSEEFWSEHDRTIPPGVLEVYQAFGEGEYFHEGMPSMLIRRSSTPSRSFNASSLHERVAPDSPVARRSLAPIRQLGLAAHILFGSAQASTEEPRDFACS